MKNSNCGTTINTQGALSDEQHAYLARAARIRQVPISVLVRELLRVICTDQMVLSILDDDSKVLNTKAGRVGRTRRVAC